MDDLWDQFALLVGGLIAIWVCAFLAAQFMAAMFVGTWRS